MSVIIGAAIGGALLALGAVLKSQAKSDVELHEIDKKSHQAFGIHEPSWSDNKAYYEARSKREHANANLALAIGAVVLIASIFN